MDVPRLTKECRFVRRLTISLMIPAILTFSSVADAQSTSRQPGNANTKSATTPEQDAQAAMSDAVARLKAGDVVGFIEFYAPVDELRRARNGNLGKTFVRIMTPQAAANVISRLERANSNAPQINLGGFLATFTIPEPPEGPANPSKTPPAAAISQEKLAGYAGSLTEVLEAAVADLQAERVELMIDRLFPRGELGHPDAAIRRKQLAARLKQHPEMVEQMLGDLQAIPRTQDVRKASKNVATISMKGQLIPTGRGRQMRMPDRVFRFEKVEGFWRFQDSTSELLNTQAKVAAKSPPPLTEFGAPDAIIMERFGDRWRFVEF